MYGHMNTLVGLSAVVIFISISMAFNVWFRTVIRLVFRMPLELMVYIVPQLLYDWWKESLFNHNKMEVLRAEMLHKASMRRQDQLRINSQSANSTASKTRPTNALSQTNDIHNSRPRRRWFGGAGAMSSLNGEPV
jgi:hypothetical protein